MRCHAGKAMSLLVLGMSLALIGGCDWLFPDETVVIDALAYGTATNTEGADWTRIVAAFEAAHQDVDIQYELLWDEAYHTRVSVRLAAGDPPDIAYMGDDARWGAPWSAAGQQFDHGPYLDTSHYDLSLIPDMGPNGEIWEIPLGTSNMTTVLFMNQALLTSLDLDAPQTYQDIAAMVPTAAAAGVDVITIDGMDPWAWGSCLMSTIIARLSGDPHWVAAAVAGQHAFDDSVFVQALQFLEQMRDDGVFPAGALTVDYGANIARFNAGQALFMIQGQWASGAIDADVAEDTLMLPFPDIAGQNAGLSGSVAAATAVGYGLTRAGAADPDVRETAFEFFRAFHSYEETTRRLRAGAIVAPILSNYTVPSDLTAIQKRKVELARTAQMTDVIDAYLSGTPNDTLNEGMQDIIAGTSTAQAVATAVEGLMNR